MARRYLLAVGFLMTSCAGGVVSSGNTGLRDFSPLLRYSWCSDDAGGGSSSGCVSLCKNKYGCYSTDSRIQPGTYNLECRTCFCQCQYTTKAADGSNERATYNAWCPAPAITESSGNGASIQCSMDSSVVSTVSKYTNWGCARCNSYPSSSSCPSDCANYWNGKI